MKPVCINFDSVYRINEGYGAAGENVLLALDEHPNVSVYTDKNWDHTEYKGLNSKTIELCKQGFSKHADFGIRFSQPDSFDQIPEAKIKIGWCLWEHNNLPRNWLEKLHKQPINFVSCTHNKRILEAAGAHNVFVVPLGIDPLVYYYRRHEQKEKFTFTISGTLNSRKQPNLVYSVFQELFKDNEEVRLIIKSTEQNRVTLAETHNIRTINETWPINKMADLLRESDCFVLPTQGEGFGLCAIEAMAVGTPVICTDWSGPADYLDDEYAYKLRYKLGRHKISNSAGLYEYAIPEREHLKELMWHVFTHQDEARDKGRKSAMYVTKNLTWKHTANRIVSILRTLSQGEINGQ